MSKDDNTSFPEKAKVSAVLHDPTFPKDAIGLDSWANCYMQHIKGLKPEGDEELTFAHDDFTMPCEREIGPKGIPIVKVPWAKTGTNIDLFPQGFLWQRGCDINQGEKLELTTPKQRKIKLYMWGDTLPYFYKKDLDKIIEDLPEHDVTGRGGKIAKPPTVASIRKCICTPAKIRSDLHHLKEQMPKEKINKICSKYKDLPECYYGGDTRKYIGPDTMIGACKSQDTYWRHVKVWEWFSGSASYSKYLKDHGITHLPPIDYRYGWNIAYSEHQKILLEIQLTHEIDTIFGAPNCAPWGNNSRSASKEDRDRRRAEEKETLMFFAVVCFFQHLLERRYIAENSAYSDIFDKDASPLALLRMLIFYCSLLDQCACGGTLEGQFIRKRTQFQSNFPYTVPWRSQASLFTRGRQSSFLS